MAQPERFEIAKLQLAAGDVLVVRPSERVSTEVARHIREDVGAMVPTGVSVLVINPGVELSVLTKAEIERRADAGISNGCD